MSKHFLTCHAAKTYVVGGDFSRLHVSRTLFCFGNELSSLLEVLIACAQVRAAMIVI